VWYDQVTGAEYTRLYLTALEDTLNKYPPPQPSTAAVNLLVTVGQQQEFLIWHSLLPPPGHPGSLDALAVRPLPLLHCVHLALSLLKCVDKWLFWLIQLHRLPASLRI